MIEDVQESSSVGHNGDQEAAPGTRVFTGQLYRVRKGHGFTFTEEPPLPPPEPVRRPARIARTLAMAHRLQDAIDRGEYKDRADAARRLGVTRARITQILDLLLLAPDIQERVLDLEACDGVEPLSERGLREVVRLRAWGEQRERWGKVTG